MNTIQNMQVKPNMARLSPLMFSNVESYLSNQKAIVDEPLDDQDLKVIALLMSRIAPLKTNRKIKVKCVKRTKTNPFSAEIQSQTVQQWSLKMTNPCTQFCELSNESLLESNHDFGIESINWNSLIPKAGFSSDKVSITFRFDHNLVNKDKINSHHFSEIDNNMKDIQIGIKVCPNLDNDKVLADDIDESTHSPKSFGDNGRQLTPLCNKYRTSNPTGKLALRADVMNKNIIRAIRRECKRLLDAYIKDNNISIGKKMDQFFNAYRWFSLNLLGKFDSNFAELNNINIEDFVIYLGALTNYWAMKKFMGKGKDFDKVQMVYELFYRYSHNRFNEFLRIPEVSILISLILKNSNSENLFQTNNTLQMNKEKYQEHIENLISAISVVDIL